MSWTVQYEANELPENATPAWTKYFTFTTNEINPEGWLHLVFDSVETVPVYKLEPELDASIGVTLEIKVDFKSGNTGYFDFQSTADGCNIWLDISDGYVEIGGNYSYETVYTTTSGVHTYRVTFIQTSESDYEINLYMDGVLIKSTPDTIAPDSDYISFATISTCEVWIDYIYYDATGVYAPASEGRTVIGQARAEATGRIEASGRVAANTRTAV